MTWGAIVCCAVVEHNKLTTIVSTAELMIFNCSVRISSPKLGSRFYLGALKSPHALRPCLRDAHDVVFGPCFLLLALLTKALWTFEAISSNGQLLSASLSATRPMVFDVPGFVSACSVSSLSTPRYSEKEKQV